MKNRKGRKTVETLAVILVTAVVLAGCGQKSAKEEDKLLSDNVLITETGEVIENPEKTDEKNSEKEESKEEKQEEANPAFEKNTNQADEIPEIVVNEPEQVITEEDQTEPMGSDLQLVFLGDSIFDSNRDGTGIPYLTSVQCDADVFNLAIGGTCAALQNDESRDPTQWSSWSMLEVINVMMGNLPASNFDGLRAGEILSNPSIDFSQTDYFIVEYGTNDFLSGISRSAQGEMFNLHSYSGALRYAVSNLMEIAPDATVILCSPCFAQFYGKDGYMVGDSNMMDKGSGSLFDYKGTCEYIAGEQGALFFNAYEDLGIDSYTADEYLEDGVHLSAEGRKLYADALAEMILDHEETKNN